MQRSEDNLDLAALSELQDLLEDEFPDLIETYLADAKLGIASMQTHLEQCEFDELRRGAHSQKGSALNIGAPSLAQLWADVEQNSGVQPVEAEKVAENIAAAVGHFALVERSLKALLAGAVAPEA